MNPETLPERSARRSRKKIACSQALNIPQTIDPEPICESYVRLRREDHGRSSSIRRLMLNELIRTGKSILFEGAQGTLLDVDHGTFPFVTSSSAAAGGVATGLGVSPKHVHSVVGISKAYTTRVGSGHFRPKRSDGPGEQLRNRGNEYGSTTGRPRRCGWFDGPAARYATMINALDSVVITKIDVLDTFDEIPFCVDYKYKGSMLKEFPADISILAEVEPVYKNIRGWKKSLAGTKEWSELAGRSPRTI